MVWTGKKVFKVTTFPTHVGVWIYEPGEPAIPPPEPGVSPTVTDGIQEQIDDINDSIESEYASGFVFDQWQDMTTSAPFYFYWEIPLGTVEIISASVSFEVKTGTGTINFTVSEDKGILYGANYGPYTTDMRAIDITGDLNGEGIKIIKLTTSANVTLTARVFLRIKISKKETPEESLDKATRPEVRTLAATSIVDVSATLNGDIVSPGKGSYIDRTTGEIKPLTVTKRGFKYGLTRTDTWDTSESATYPIGTFGISATSLTAETNYYFRAYAENQVGRSYGEYVKLTTAAPVAIMYMVYKNDVSGITYINGYDTNGSLASTWTIETTESVGNAIAVDTNGNVYTITSDQHSIKKRNSSGTLTLTKTETNYIYNIAAGPDGYIYTQEYTGAVSRLNKRNASDLVSVGTKTIGGNTYYGMAIDSDGDFYLMNDTDSKYERWDFTSGLVSSVTADHHNLNSIGVVSTKLADVHWLSHALHRLKDLSGAETDVELTDMTQPGAVGSTSTHFLFAGYGDSSMLVLGKYDTSLTKVWTTIVPSSANYSYGSIASYPF